MSKQLKFSHKILLVAAVIVSLALAAFAVFNAYLQRNAIDQSLRATLSETGKVTASNIAYWLDARVKLIESEVQVLARDSSPAVLVEVLGQTVYTNNFDRTFLGETNGTYTARPAYTPAAGYDPRKRPWYIAATSAGATAITPPYVFASTGKSGLTISTPLQRDGHQVGVVAGDLNLTTLIDMLASLDVGGLGEAFLVDSDGKILVSSHP
ncbi:cache domain-containing protein [Pseudomonas cedrina]|uniref:cache domain-containing protein n=1 Tax=Pseudomonas cedrina TaxID=651740 RepID=UPI0013EF03BC